MTVSRITFVQWQQIQASSAFPPANVQLMFAPIHSTLKQYFHQPKKTFSTLIPHPFQPMDYFSIQKFFSFQSKRKRSNPSAIYEFVDIERYHLSDVRDWHVKEFFYYLDTFQKMPNWGNQKIVRFWNLKTLTNWNFLCFLYQKS